MIYILLPAYNEGKALESLLKRIKTGMENRSFNYQVIAYNDGSTDNTLDILNQNKDDIAVVLDSDNTHNPEHIYQMVNKIWDGFDVAIASRYLQDSRVVGVAQHRQFLSLGASWMMRILFPIRGVKDYTCGYRAYSLVCLRKAFEKFGDELVQEKGFACMAELLIKVRSLRVLAVEVPLVLRYDLKGGYSKMDILKTIKRTLLMLLRLKNIK